MEFLDESAATLDLQTSMSATQCTVCWYEKSFLQYFFCVTKVHIINVSQPSNRVCHKEVSLPFHELHYSWVASAEDGYFVYIEVHNPVKQKVVATGCCHIRAGYSKRELRLLYDLAQQHSGTEMQKITEAYRCKPLQYWKDILRTESWIMKPYKKDKNGHSENHINRELYGLFFSVAVNRDGSQRPSSYFGDFKYSLTPSEIFDPREVNFYFCDFYCNYKCHFVTIVVCPKFSPADTFCAHKLIPLPTTNSFFKVIPGLASSTYYTSKNICVELFFTDEVLLCLGNFKPINPIGRGTSLTDGLRNNKTCDKCNLEKRYKVCPKCKNFGDIGDFDLCRSCEDEYICIRCKQFGDVMHDTKLCCYCDKLLWCSRCGCVKNLESVSSLCNDCYDIACTKCGDRGDKGRFTDLCLNCEAAQTCISCGQFNDTVDDTELCLDCWQFVPTTVHKYCDQCGDSYKYNYTGDIDDENLCSTCKETDDFRYDFSDDENLEEVLTNDDKLGWVQRMEHFCTSVQNN